MLWPDGSSEKISLILSWRVISECLEWKQGELLISFCFLKKLECKRNSAVLSVLYWVWVWIPSVPTTSVSCLLHFILKLFLYYLINIWIAKSLIGVIYAYFWVFIVILRLYSGTYISNVASKVGWKFTGITIFVYSITRFLNMHLKSCDPGGKSCHDVVQIELLASYHSVYSFVFEA